MDGHYRSVVEMALPDLRVERLVQDRSGPFERCHQLDEPSIVYMTRTGEEAAIGCFGEPRSHRSFSRFGSAIVVPAQVPLHVRSHGFSGREMIVVRFDRDRFAELTGLSAGLEDALLASCVDVRAAGIAATLDRLSIEMARPSIARETIVAGLGMVLLGELARHFDEVRQSGAPRGGLADWQLRRIEARLEDEGRYPPDLSELADLCGISRRHLMRAWKATMGGTVMDRVEQFTFDRARRMLEERQDLPVKTIAGSCGFAGQAAFSTAFRRRFGISPTTWRQRYRAGRPH